MRHRHDQKTRVLLPGKSVSCRLRASLTVEAALCLPLFFLAAVLIMLLLETAFISLQVHSAACYAAQVIAAGQIENPVSMDQGLLKERVVSSMGTGPLAENLLVGGKNGISLGESTLDSVTGVGYIRWDYRVRMPFPVFNSPVNRYKGEIKFKAWNGYHGADHENEQEEMVYVAENGIVYHKNPSCTHLALSITPVSFHNLSTCRNQNGGKYHACEKCGQLVPVSGTVYITREGDRWHVDKNCSGLKRTVERIPISQAGGRRPCSRCSQ